MYLCLCVHTQRLVIVIHSRTLWQLSLTDTFLVHNPIAWFCMGHSFQPVKHSIKRVALVCLEFTFNRKHRDRVICHGLTASKDKAVFKPLHED